ncbi:sensor histidine kinase [Aureibacillus halotolerans]|uniref:histidine kinase n=1 Tax=Aureibacillus halotolerans TaxID=1508390 RepID=A0A4R6U205_9BACI|nr:HAMP domain-containing sensor histidine kinase [Aureibacillus halotolerans]TDQ40370.1 phospho-acceptor domain-containing protein [Aureibacillus halotolerans]
MKWKLTGSYLFSIISIILIVFIVNTIILISMWYSERSRAMDGVTSDSAETFTREFTQYLSMNNGEPFVSQNGKQALEAYDAWLQILDGNGNVVSSYQAPATASTHYSAMEIVHKYKYMDDELNTYFLGEYEDFSYIVGLPDAEERRVVFMIDAPSFLSYASEFLLIIIIVDLVIAGVIGLLFSTILTKPVNTMIERISQLKQQNFHSQQPKKPGLFKSVFSNLNDVSETLSKNESERMKLEKMRNEWISNASHDLKTPLASVRGYAELLRSAEVTAEERLDYAEVIERQSIYMKELLDDFTLTMRLRNKELPLQLAKTPVEAFIKELVIDLLNDPQFEGRNISFKSEAQDLELSIDQHLMKRALLNLICNALIHNEDDTTVAVTIQTDALFIEDNGKGIPAGELEQIFDRYYRGTDTNNSHGTGLGMAISRDIIEAHGMTLELVSQTGKGTIVKISF